MIPIPLIISGSIELIKLASDLLDTWKNNPEDQAALDAKWNAMQQKYAQARSAWEGSKGGPA